MSRKTPAPNGHMTSVERASLMVLIRQRERVARTAVDEHKARLKADFEKQLAAIYKPSDDPVWAEARREVDNVVAEVNSKIAARCDELGIVSSFRPEIEASWWGRGENGAAERRAELARIATSELDAQAKAAYAAITRASVEAQTELMASVLSSEAAQAFLQRLPTPEQLLPPISIERAEQLLGERRGGRRLRYRVP